MVVGTSPAFVIFLFTELGTKSNYFLAVNNYREQTLFFYVFTFARSRGRCWNMARGIWQMLKHENPCLITIIAFIIKQNFCEL